MFVIKENIKNEIIIKNSRFITLLYKIDEDININNYLDDIKNEYPKATHYCYAYITIKNQKSSDDNEPSGTAGIPMLSTLENENITNCLAVVVRYFGGIKLGATGLTRAYRRSVKETLEKTEIVPLVKALEIIINTSYDKVKLLDKLLINSEIIDKQFTEEVIYHVIIDEDLENKLTVFNYKIIKSTYKENRL